jgi:hypothetical protein
MLHTYFTQKLPLDKFNLLTHIAVVMCISRHLKTHRSSLSCDLAVAVIFCDLKWKSVNVGPPYDSRGRFKRSIFYSASLVKGPFGIFVAGIILL